MGVDNKVRQIYEQVIHEVTQSQDAWKSVLRLAGQIYRYEFDNILMVYAQKPHATLVADFDTWKKVGRFVKCGSKGAAIYPSKALKPYMRYVFDISDTGGRQTKLTWDLEGDSLEKFMNYQTENGRYPAYERLSREDSVTALKDFTKQMVQEIMEEEFGERISEFSQITGSVIIEENEKRESLQHTENIYDIVKKSILYVVGTRCGFDLSAEEQDFSQIVNITDEDMIYRLGSLICDVSCNVLRAYGRDCEAATKERRIAYGSRDELQGGRRDFVPGSSGTGRDREPDADRKVRTSGDELSEGERGDEVQESAAVRKDDREDEGSGRGSKSYAGSVDDTVSEVAQTSESEQYHGDVETQRTGKDDGGRDRPHGDSVQVSLEDDEEFNKELNELDSFGTGKEAVTYRQASFFDAEYGSDIPAQSTDDSYIKQFEADKKEALSGKYNYLNPKKETMIPAGYIRQVLLRGSGFAGGKSRICKIYENEFDAGTRAKEIRKEYGMGGAGWPIDGYGLHGYDT